MKKADRIRIPLHIVPWIAAFLFSALAVAFRFSSEIVERRETIQQRIPAVQAEIAGFSAAVRLPEIDVSIERPLRLDNFAGIRAMSWNVFINCLLA